MKCDICEIAEAKRKVRKVSINFDTLTEHPDWDEGMLEAADRLKKLPKDYLDVCDQCQKWLDIYCGEGMRVKPGEKQREEDATG